MTSHVKKQERQVMRTGSGALTGRVTRRRPDAPQDWPVVVEGEASMLGRPELAAPMVAAR